MRVVSVERSNGVGLRGVRKAYEQVADQLRELIVSGELARGERLPNEQLLAREFGVSRATVREALRLLAAQSLIRTSKGAGGGSYVTLPSAGNISDLLESSLELLHAASEVGLEELLEVRELLEVPAARLAAERRSDEDAKRLAASIPGDRDGLDATEHYFQSREFHRILIETADNILLTIASQPVFSVLETHLSRSALAPGFHVEVDRQHALVARAVEAGDAEAAGEAMRSHLDYLRGFYEQAWTR